MSTAGGSILAAALRDSVRIVALDERGEQVPGGGKVMG